MTRSDALYRDKPESGIAYVHPDYVQPVEELVETLVRLTRPTPMSPGRNGDPMTIISMEADGA